MNKNIPIYQAIIEDELTGMFTISLVDKPAVESNFLCFKKDHKIVNFRVENEEKRLISGVIMRADFPIYRINEYGEEYYITFSRETIAKMAEKWLSDGLQSNVNLQHNPNNYVNDVLLKEVYFKDSEKGINPKGFEGIEEGSLFATYHILNEDVWKSIKNGEFNGFSLEGIFNFDITPSEEDKEYDEIMSMLDRIEKIKNK